MANLEQDNLIRITHYINPHNFWFKQESAYLFNGDEQNFQDELSKFCDETYGRGNISCGIYTPGKVGETVAVYYFQLARWIRATVDAIFPDLSGQVQCNLWAIDEGVPVKTSCRYIKPLPEKYGLGRVPTAVMRGGLVGVLPAECSYDYLQGCNVTQIVTNWSPGVVRIFEGCIEEAVTISFDCHHYKVTGIDMYFGDMKITSHQNVTNNAADLLKKAGGKMVMLVDQQQFYDHLPTLRTLDMQRYEDNERVENMKYHSNTFRPEYSVPSKSRHATRMCSYDNQALEQAREKVLDWDERNKRNASVVDFTPKTTAPPATEKQNRPMTRAYAQLINESFSEDEEPPQVEIKLPAFQPKQPPKEKPAVPSSPYQRPNARVYDVEVADIQVALDAIKLRRQASANLARNEPATTTNSKQAGGTTACPLNLIPAGFNMGNLHFDGSTIAGGTSEVETNKRHSTASLFHRHGRHARKDYGSGSESKLRKPRHQYREDAGDSSSEEEVVRKVSIAPFKPDEENEQW